MLKKYNKLIYNKFINILYIIIDRITTTRFVGFSDGYVTHYLRGTARRHRLSGPAAYCVDLLKKGDCYYVYCINNKIHRTDGPAYSYQESDVLTVKKYYLHGIEYTKDEWFSKLTNKQRLELAFKLDEI